MQEEVECGAWRVIFLGGGMGESNIARRQPSYPVLTVLVTCLAKLFQRNFSFDAVFGWGNFKVK